jgi:triosephosphate isomerase
MRKRIIAGNWKMNKTVSEAVELAQSLKESLKKNIDVDVVICPPFTNLTAVSAVIKNTRIGLGAQNIYWEDKGAFTGEISAAMLKSAGCTYVILGHSERRQFFHETDESVNKKIKRALQADLTPIVCVGETLDERKSERTEAVVTSQVSGCLNGLSKEETGKIVIAYEPVWAIGTGVVATPQQAQDVHKLIRDLLAELYDRHLADALRIQYGGSMKPDNAAELLSQPDIDGGLIGGASLDVKSFLGIIEA